MYGTAHDTELSEISSKVTSLAVSRRLVARAALTYQSQCLGLLYNRDKVPPSSIPALRVTGTS